MTRLTLTLQQGYKSTAAFLRYFIHQNYAKPLETNSAHHSSEETSDLSAEDSDYSPCHACSCESNEDITDDEHEMVTSLSSKTSRSSKSPSKSVGSQATQTDEFEVHVAIDIHSTPDDEEVIVAEVEHLPGVEGNVNVQSIKALQIDESKPQKTSQSAHSLSTQSEDISVVHNHT